MKTIFGVALLGLGWAAFLGLMCYAYIFGHAHEEARPVALAITATAVLVPQIVGWVLIARDT